MKVERRDELRVEGRATRPLRASQHSTQIPLNLVRRAWRFCLSLCLLLSVAGAGWGQEAKPERPATPEVQRANYVVAFATFAEWPTNAFTAPDLFVVGILGSDPCATVLRSEPVRIGDRKLVVTEFKDLEGTEQCQLLLVTEAWAGKMAEVLAHLKNASVLTVVETGKTVSKEAMINLRIGKKLSKKTKKEFEGLVFDVYESPARQAGLKLRRGLLEYAATVF